MARKVEVLIVDDLNGDPAEETVRFGVDGAHYEIDLSADNAGAMRDALARYVAVARKTGRAATGTGARSGRAGSAMVRSVVDREQNQAIREWAKARGIKVNDRGRIPGDIVAKYHAGE